ncbi:MAG: ABC transporter substrate-binding protein [Microbacterium sp.]|uniref:ABC transporter substrate-binding protein n=1 Tax=Microbacterium sp. TaxID=51671 RepID=UPI0039E6DF70
MPRTISSHRGALGAFALAGVLMLTACTGSDGPSESTPAASESALLPAAEGKTTYPLTLATPWGTSELTERPERIATITGSQDDVEIVVALGGTPVIASEWTTDAFIEENLTQEIPLRFTTGDEEFPLESIAAAEPDLIIVLGTDLTDVYDKLTAIAPVLGATEAGVSEGSVAADWEENILRVGEALDLQDAAQAALATEEQFFTDFREEHPELDGLTATYVVYYGQEDGLEYHSSADGPASWVFERMGFAPNPLAEKFDYRQTVSDELLSKIDADILVVSDNSDGDSASLTDQPLFQNLSAVQDGHLILIENLGTSFIIDGVESDGNVSWALARSGPLSATWAASHIAPALDAVLAD